MTPASHNAGARVPDMFLLQIAEYGGRSGGAACPQDAPRLARGLALVETAKRVGDNALHLGSSLQSSVRSENPNPRFSRRENLCP
jgi:hypothetical protein